MEHDIMKKIQADRQQLMPDVEAQQEKPFDLKTASPLDLQKVIGNKATTNLLTGAGGAGPVVQTKMTVTDANDAHEQEADKVAEKIVSGGGEQANVQRMDEDQLSAKRLQRGIMEAPAENEEMPEAPVAEENAPAEEAPVDENEDAPGGRPENAPAEENAPGLGRQEAAEPEEAIELKRLQRDAMEEAPEVEEGAEEEEAEADVAMAKRLQRNAVDMSKSFDVGGDIEDQIKSTRGGQSLDGGIQAKMEQGTGHDFSGVKVHTDSNADALSNALGARAFTSGSDIFFKSGEYNPGSAEGDKLIAHEATHVIQQGGTQLKREDGE